MYTNTEQQKYISRNVAGFKNVTVTEVNRDISS